MAPLGRLRFGAFFADIRRKRLKLSLREFCKRNGFNPGNLSRLERGKTPPPKSPKILKRYATALDLKKGSDDWVHFFDLAAAERGEIPTDLMSDKDLVRQLPALFRTLRGGRVRKLRELSDLVRKQ